MRAYRGSLADLGLGGVAWAMLRGLCPYGAQSKELRPCTLPCSKTPRSIPPATVLVTWAGVGEPGTCWCRRPWHRHVSLVERAFFQKSASIDTPVTPMKNGVTGRKQRTPNTPPPRYHPEQTTPPQYHPISGVRVSEKKTCVCVCVRVCVAFFLGFPCPQHFGRVRLYSAGGSI